MSERKGNILVGLLLIAGIFGGVGYYLEQASLGTALRILTPQQGGTGIGSATVGDVGDCLSVSDDSPFTFTLDTCGSGGGGSDFTFVTHYDAKTAATTSPVRIGGALFASSTIYQSNGGVMNWNNGDFTITHASNAMALAGGTMTLTYADPPSPFTAFNVLSGGASNYTGIGLGRTSQELILGIAAATNHFITGTAAGDSVIRNAASKLFLYSNTGGIVVSSGNVGVGDTTPASLFTVGNGDLFQVDSSGFASVRNWTVATTTSVCKYNCEFTSIQSAIDAGYNDIEVKTGTYNEFVSITRSDIRIRGGGMYSTLITCNGAVANNACVSVATSTQLTRITLEDFGIDNTNASKVGYGLDTSNTSNVYTKNIRITDFATGHIIRDTTNTSFYSNYVNMVYFDNNNCLSIGGTLVNDNTMVSSRCRVADSTGEIGYDINNAEGWNFISPNSEPGTTIGTAMRIRGNSVGISVINPWFESNATGTEIHSGSLNTRITGGRITANTVGVMDKGTGSVIDSIVTANTTNFTKVSSQRHSIVFNPNPGLFSSAFMGIGTTTQEHVDQALVISRSSSNSNAAFLKLVNIGAFASGPAGIEFDNAAGSFPNGTAKIISEPGSGFTASVLEFHVADSSKVLQQRMTIDVGGDVGIATTTPQFRLTVHGTDNSTASQIHIPATQANITTADTFMEFTSSTGVEGSVAGTGVGGVIAYNTFTGSHWTEIDDKNGLEVGMLLEATGESVTFGKEHLSKAKIACTRGSKAVYGAYGGTNESGQDLVLALGTGKMWITNKGQNLEVGDLLMSSNRCGYAEKQKSSFLGLFERNNGVIGNITAGKVMENVVWKEGETEREVNVIYLGG